jgi:hypothetical protein
MKKDFFLYHILPGALFAGLVLLFIISMAMSRIQPQILSVEPSRVSPGDLMILKGRNFGIARGKSKVYLDQNPLTASFIESWSDDQLKVRVPPVSRSGLISVETSGGRSRGSLFVLSDRVPDLASGAFLPGKPFLSGINKSSFRPGDLIVLEGDKMGMRRKNSTVLVSLSGRAPENILDQPDENHFLEVGGDHISSWQDDHLSFYLPEEARSGPVYVKTPSGYSNPISIDVLPREEPLSGEVRRVTLRQSIGLSHIAALPGNSLALWIPEPADRPGQTLISKSSVWPRPLILEELESLEPRELSSDYDLEIRSLSYDLEGAEHQRSYENLSMLESWLTEEEDLSVSALSRTAKAVIKRESRPYRKAKLIYDYIQWKLSIDPEYGDENMVHWVRDRKSRAEGYARFFVSLCRAAAVPSRVVSGIWLPPGGDEGIPHCWAEIYLPGIGWFPVDAAAADGALSAWIPEDAKEQPGGWGRLDAGYVAFSRGLEKNRPLYDIGRLESAAPYGRQTLFAEFLGNLDSCSISWENIAIMAR